VARLLPLGAVLLLPVLAGCGSGSGTVTDGTTYFVVSRPASADSDSYLLPLTDPDDIAHARALIADRATAGAQIVVARIDRGSSDGVTDNRDLLNEGRRWSWHVTEFLGFAEATIEILDGSPTYVEANLDDWMRITGGEIGFWSYTVTCEVSPSELGPGR